MKNKNAWSTIASFFICLAALLFLFCIEGLGILAWISFAIMIAILLILLCNHITAHRLMKKCATKSSSNRKLYNDISGQKIKIDYYGSKRLQQFIEINPDVCPSCGMIIDPMNPYCRCSK